jgi:hypothetical protein
MLHTPETSTHLGSKVVCLSYVTDKTHILGRGSASQAIKGLVRLTTDSRCPFT